MGDAGEVREEEEEEKAVMMMHSGNGTLSELPRAEERILRM